MTLLHRHTGLYYIDGKTTERLPPREPFIAGH